VRYVVGGPRGGNVHLRLAQYERALDDGRALTLAKTIVAAKIHSGERLVRRWARDADEPDRFRLNRRGDRLRRRLERVDSARSLDHLRGIEGDAARSYFQAVEIQTAATPLPFVGRNRRPPRDPVNALLGFAYGLATAELTGAADAVGLDHQIGFLHRPRSGRPSLSLDLLEELRPVVDRLVIRMVTRREIGPEHFTRTPGGAVYLSDDGRRHFLGRWEAAKVDRLAHPFLDREVDRWALPMVQATLLARHLRGDLTHYPPYVIGA